MVMVHFEVEFTYGRTKPAVYEVNPGDINTKEVKANMRVLFEVVVK